MSLSPGNPKKRNAAFIVGAEVSAFDFWLDLVDFLQKLLCVCSFTLMSRKSVTVAFLLKQLSDWLNRFTSVFILLSSPGRPSHLLDVFFVRIYRCVY